MRTVSVFSVIFYHARVTVGDSQVFSGGYLGVDIFFVISGYLITTLLLQELEKDGRISVLNFYERRARRLLPALLVVMLVSLPFAWRYLIPIQLVSFSESLIASIFFLSNFFWNSSLQEYGANSALLQPFLHTWSLAIEEQYYIIFPLLLYAIHRWCRGQLFIALLLLFLVSLVFSEIATARDSSFAFYMLPARFWELLAGGLIAIISLKYFEFDDLSRWQKLMPTVGILLIGVSLFGFNLDQAHPGFITLVPVTGACLIILFTHKRNWVTRCLSQPAMIYFGLLSYSLYLWHYPVFAFGRMANITPSLIDKALWIGLSIFLATLSYYIVEKPFRGTKVSRKRLLITIFLSSSVVLVTSLYWVRSNGMPERGRYVQDLLQANTTKLVYQDGRDCMWRPSTGEKGDLTTFCLFENYPGDDTLVLIGDSHANAIANSLKTLAHANRLNYAQVVAVACPHVSNMRGTCGTRYDALDNFLKGLQNPTIVYTAHLPLYIERKRFVNPESTADTKHELARSAKTLEHTYPEDVSGEVIESLNKWVSDGYRVIIVYPVPEQGFNAAINLAVLFHNASNAGNLPTLSTRYDLFQQRAASSYSTLNSIKGPNVRRVYPEKLFCRVETNRCIASEKDRIYFGNDNHASPLAADMIVREIAVELELKVPESFRN